jgi:hypothetical protein
MLDVEPSSPVAVEPDVRAEALVLFNALTTVEPGRVTAIATAPTRPAAPAPRVRAEIRASPLLRASCRSDPEVGELFTSCSDPARGVR